MEADEMGFHKSDWKVGENCLVRKVIDNQMQWSRAVVTGVKSLQLKRYDVLLIDENREHIAVAEDMLIIADHVQQGCQEVFKVHLANAIPTGGDTWSFSAIDMFKHTVKLYKTTEVSIVGDSRDDGSIPTILWGVSYQKFGLINQKQYHNIFEYLRLEGYVDSSSKLSPEQLIKLERAFTEDEFGTNNVASNISTPEQLRECDKSQLEIVIPLQEMKIGDRIVKLNASVINSWISAETATRGSFTGHPSGVDDDGVIYIRNDKQRETLTLLEKALTDFYSKQPQESWSIDIEIGQPIVVQSNLGTGRKKNVHSKHSFKDLFRF